MKIVNADTKETEEVEGETDKVNTLETKAKASFVSLLKCMGDSEPPPLRPGYGETLTPPPPPSASLNDPGSPGSIPITSEGGRMFSPCPESEISVILGEGILNPCLVDEIYMGVMMQCSNNDTSSLKRAWQLVRDPTTWTILRHDGPNHLEF